MTRSEMLQVIARHAYNVGFGSRKNFATFDIISKASGWISFISLSIGVFALFVPLLATNVVSAILIIFGVVTMYIQFYDNEKSNYEKAGNAQIQIFNKLEVLYRNVKSDDYFDYVSAQKSVDILTTEYYSTVISKQIFGSNWYAHYKFFCEFEKRWVEDELKLTFKDKIPVSLYFFAAVFVSLGVFLFL